jgi:hypothetical protein
MEKNTSFETPDIAVGNDASNYTYFPRGIKNCFLPSDSLYNSPRFETWLTDWNRWNNNGVAPRLKSLAMQMLTGGFDKKKKSIGFPPQPKSLLFRSRS